MSPSCFESSWARLVLALAAPCALAVDAAAAQSEDSALVTYDLRAVMPRWDASSSWSQRLLLTPAASPHQELPSLDDSLQYAELASFELLDLLTQILGDELRREGRELMVEGHVLTVLAPASLHEQVRSILESLASALGGSVPLRIDVLTLGEGAGELPRAVLLGDAEARELVGALVARGARHEGYELELSAGRTARLDAYRCIPFLFDYEVEISQAMAVFEPVMSETREGMRLGLRGLSVPGGLALSAVLLRTELLGDVPTQALTLQGLVSHAESGPIEVLGGPDGIQSPKVLARGLAFDTFLPDGKALALTLEATLGAAKTREVLLVRRLGGALSSYVAHPIPRTNRTLIALDAGLFRAPRMALDAGAWVDDQTVLQPSVVATLEGGASGFLLEWLKARFSIWRRFGPWILVVTDPAWDRDAAAQLDRLVKSLRPDTTLYDVSVALRAQGRDAPYPVRMRLPLLGGTSAGLVLGRGETAVTGFGVEVAQGSSAPDPYVSSLFDGLALALSLEGLTLEVSGVAQLLDAPIRVLESGYAVLGPIARPESRVLRFDERIELREGRTGPVRIGRVSERADQPGLALEITVAPIPR